MTTQQINTKTVDDEQAARNRRAFRLLLVLGIVVFTAGSAVFLRIWAQNEYGYHPDLAQPVAAIIGGLVFIGSAFLAKRGSITSAVAITAIAFFVVDFFLMTQLDDIGLPFTIAVTIGLILIASQVLPRQHIVTAVVFIFSTGVFLILIDLFWTATRGVVDYQDMRIVYVAAVIIVVVGLAVGIRKFPKFTLRTKLISVAITLVVITVLLTTVLVNNFTRNALTQQLNQEFQLVGESQSVIVSKMLERQIEILEGLSLDSGLRPAMVAQNNGVRYHGTEEESLNTLLSIEEGWPNNTDLRKALTTNSVALTLRGLQEKFPNHKELTIIDSYGALVGATDIPANYYFGNTEWWQAVHNDGQARAYIGEPTHDEGTGEIIIDFVIPLYDVFDTSELNGFVISRYSLVEVATLLENVGRIGETGHWKFVFNDSTIQISDQLLGFELIDNNEALLNRLQDSSELIVAWEDGKQNILGWVPLDTNGRNALIDSLGWSLITAQAEEEAFATVQGQQQIAVIMALVAIVIGAIIAVYAAGYIADPINRLTDTAVVISEGNLNRRASVETEDEIGTLAIAFNRMTDQLRTFIGSLEEQVTERTKALATSTEVSRQLSTILNMDVLVSEVASQVRNSFGYYHAQIYLYDTDKEYLLMAGGTGEAGRQMLESGHKLASGRGLVGRAAELNQVVLISDVTQDEDWLANDLLPHTQSEAAVPIALGDDVIGVLDVQHNVAGGLDEEGVALLQSIANQVAIAIQNARQYEQTQQALAESERLNNVTIEQARRLAALNEMTTAFNSAVSEQDVFNIVGENLLNIIAGDRASIALLDENDKERAEVRLLGGEAFDQIDKTQISLPNTAIGLSIRENRIIRLPADAPMTDYGDGRLFEKRGFHSLMVVPLQFGGRILGTLNIGNKQVQEFRDSGMDFIQQVASTIATNLEGQRVGERARLLASIVENHPDFIGVGSLRGEAIYVNPSGLELLALPLNTNLAELDASTMYSPEEGALLMDEGIPAAIEKGSWTAEVNLNKADGTVIPVEETIGINYDANNQPVSFSMTMRDITDRKEAELAIRESYALADEFQEKLKTLYELTIELTRENDLKMIYKRAIEGARARLGFDRIGLWLFNDAVTQMQGTFGTDEKGELVDISRLHEEISKDVEDGWILRFIEDNQRYLINEEADLYDDYKHIVGHGWQVLVILWNEDQPLGFLSADNLILQRPMKSYEPDLVILLANALSNIIVNKRAEASQARHARELQTVTEVSRTATTILDTKELLQQTVDLTKEQFGLYHAHIYLMNPNQDHLVLTAGAGDVGRIMVDEGKHIPLHATQSLVAQAARTKKGVKADNVHLDPNFLPNPLLPSTRSELATPIIASGEVLGVLDIQSDQADYFTQSDIDVQSTLAAQIAVAMQNAAQYQRTQEALENVTRMQQLLVQDGWKSFVANEEQQVHGYRFDQNNLQPIQHSDEMLVGEVETERESAVLLPLTVRGANIGKLGVRDASGRPVSKEKLDLLQSMSAQVAEALERARLFQQTEIARTQTEAALRETQRRTEELAAINKIVTELGASLDVTQSMNIVADGIAQNLGVEQCRIALLDDEGSELTIVAEHIDPEKSSSALGMVIPVEGNTLTQEVMKTREPAFIQDVANDPLVAPVRDMLQAQGIRSLVVLPMIVGSGVLGTVGIDLFEEDQRLTNEQIELAQTIIFQAATAVQNARLYTQTQKRAERERLVNTINQKIQGTTTVEEALQTAIEELGRALRAQKTRVALQLEKSEHKNGGQNGS